MKKILLLTIVFFTTGSFAQCVIEMNSSSCVGNNAAIQIMSGEIYDQYQWYFKPVNSTGNFQVIAGATNPSLTCDWATYDQTLIKVECFYNFGINYFSNTIELNLLNCDLGVPDKSISELRLFPNPVEDYLMLSGFDKLDKIEIYNTIGQKVFTSTEQNGNRIDTSSLTSGVYILRAVSGNNSKQIRFIKS